MDDIYFIVPGQHVEVVVVMQHRYPGTDRDGGDQDHVAPLPRISSRSPSQPDPRRRRAAARLRGAAASVLGTL